MKRFVYGGLVLIAIYSIVMLSLYALQKQIIFHPKPLPQSYEYQFDAPFKEHFLNNPDGSRVNALFFPTEQAAPKQVILYLHGNSDNLQRWAQYHTDFTDRGYDFLAIDYRGYGKSEGELHEEYFYQDAKTAYQWLRQRYTPEQIVIFGRSLGTSIASHLAARVPARLLLLETPFDDIAGVLRAWTKFVPFESHFHFSNKANLPKVDYPIHIFQGTRDWIVPYQSAIQLQPLLKSKDSFMTIQGGGHHNLGTYDLYQQRLDALLNPANL